MSSCQVYNNHKLIVSLTQVTINQSITDTSGLNLCVKHTRLQNQPQPPWTRPKICQRHRAKDCRPPEGCNWLKDH